MDTLDKECWIWSFQAVGKQEEHSEDWLMQWRRTCRRLLWQRRMLRIEWYEGRCFSVVTPKAAKRKRGWVRKLRDTNLYDTNLKFIVFIFSEKLYLSYFYTLIWRNFHLQICPFALKNNILFQLHAAFEFNNFLPASCVFVAHLMTIIEITNSIRLSWCWGISYAL